MNLFLNYSVQLYIKQGIINPNDKHALMREYARLMSEENRKFNRTSNAGQVSVFAFDQVNHAERRNIQAVRFSLGRGWKCSKSALKRRMKEGKLKSYKLGRSRKIAESDLNAFLVTQKQHQTRWGGNALSIHGIKNHAIPRKTHRQNTVQKK